MFDVYQELLAIAIALQKKKKSPFSEIKNTNKVEPFTFFDVLRTYLHIFKNLCLYFQ